MSESKNRWSDEVGMAGYDKIMCLSPAHGPLRIVVAKELARRQSEFDYVVDLGAGTGDSARSIIQETRKPIVLVDSNHRALITAQLLLSRYLFRVIEAPDRRILHLSSLELAKKDLLEYLQEKPLWAGRPALTSSWTIHNFLPERREKIFKACADHLRRHGGRYFVLMDQIYPDGSEDLRHEMFERAIALYSYLDDEKTRNALIKHERADFQIRMLEDETVRQLEKVGFNVIIGPRVERDLVLICELKD